VLVVVDMLLTGFDAPIEQVLYLDRGLREHGLLQAIARVNRPCTVTRGSITTEKTYGLVVDYWGVSQELDSALMEFEKADVLETWQPAYADPAPVIDAAARRAESYFKRQQIDDTWACVYVFAPDRHTTGDFKADLFEKFSADYRRFAVLMDQYLPDKGALPYVDRLAQLTKIRAYTRATFRREDAAVDWDDVTAKVRYLLNTRIDATMVELMKPVSILDEEFTDKVNAIPHDEARASVMEHALRAQITEHLADNPAFYEKLSEQLERVIAQMRQAVIDASTAVKQLGKLRLEALSVADLAAKQGLNEVSFAVYELLEQTMSSPPSNGGPSTGRSVREGVARYSGRVNPELRQAALSIEEVMRRGQSIVDWQNKEDVLRIMRRDIKRELRKVTSLTEDQINELAVSMVEIARRKLRE
jgi:type I restriction enzyme R subunit